MEMGCRFSTVVYREFTLDKIRTKVFIDRVIDGDTFDLLVRSTPFGPLKVRTRLYGIDTPEKNTGEGKLAKELVERRLSIARKIEAEFLKKDKYGRQLAKISMDGIDLTQYLIENKIGVAYFGGKKTTTH